jgi:hypothetical protein
MLFLELPKLFSRVRLCIQFLAHSFHPFLQVLETWFQQLARVQGAHERVVT